ncbi:PiggyBac transposable element-derived protein 4 [Trichinella murrelli]|uniref:PiggyBac transposable element-derived protein 4 n=1 Tax=Trichinella murrelli TaxID=144512 RepID=A0A0V0TUA3_9BILA|nr:PiggyBac transposable element-derived protein 4 [Trichinella murrelli]
MSLNGWNWMSRRSTIMTLDSYIRRHSYPLNGDAGSSGPPENFLVLFWQNAKTSTAVVFYSFLEMAVGYFCQLARSYLRLVLSSCLSYILLIYPIFSQTVQSLTLILWLRVFYLIVNEMSITGSDNDSFLEILNDSLEESDRGSASDSDYVEKSDHDSSSEFSGTLSSDSETEEVIHERSDSWIGRDRVCLWNKEEPSKNVRTRPHNIYSGRQGPRSAARHAKTPCEIWSLFMTKDIIDAIVLNTNIYIGNIRTKYYVRERSAKDTDEDEIKALLGLLLLAGVFQSNRLNLCDLYNTDGTGVEIFPSTMSLQRLRFLLRCLRFDDHATRAERKRQDKLAAIRMVFDTFVRNCTENYMHSAHVTIDEVLVSFKDRCPFRILRNVLYKKMEVYVGKQTEGPHQMDTSPAAVVKRLCSAIVGTGRNITMDNWFMSYSLVEDLLKEKLTAVGTMRKNKRQIPAAFIDTKHREQNSSRFGYQKNMTLVSYVPKKIRTSYY